MSQQKNPNSGPAYRPDIDGLRAIAVASVLGYHAFPRLLPGGLTGVDVFFVVSGYLIAGLIYADLERGSFSFRKFYARRFRRIFPALITVLGACLLYGWFALAPDEYRELGRQVAAGAGFGANLLFWHESGYFDADAGLKPLLHLWSLGVEEQFYLTWPAVIVLAGGRSTRLLYVTASVLLATFGCSILLQPIDPTAAFYLPVPRFWELLLGALLAYFLQLAPKSAPAVPAEPAPATANPSGSASVLAWAGIALILASLWLINRGSSFPGWWALLPTAGTALVITTPGAWLNRRVLASRPFVFVGLISYPLYLWHWVLLAFARIANYGDEPPRPWRLAAIAASFGLAWLTYRLVERPIRFSPRRGSIPGRVVASMAACGLAGLAVYGADGGAFRYPHDIRALAAVRYDAERDHYEQLYRGGSCFLGRTDSFAGMQTRCVDRPNGASRLVALWGDSHAASLYPGLKAMAVRGDFRVAQFTASACPPIPGLQRRTQPNCKSFNDAVIAQLSALRPDVLILEAHWALYGRTGSAELDTSELRRTVETLRRMGFPRIVVMGSLPSWKIYQPRAAFEIWRRRHALVSRSDRLLDPAVFAADSLVRAAVSGTGAIFLSPLQLLCDPEGCLLSTDPQTPTPIAWDNDHLSVAGSTLLLNLAFDAIMGTQAGSQPTARSAPSL